jgi:hypothetical protein
LYDRMKEATSLCLSQSFIVHTTQQNIDKRILRRTS